MLPFFLPSSIYTKLVLGGLNMFDWLRDLELLEIKQLLISAWTRQKDTLQPSINLMQVVVLKIDSHHLQFT